LAELSSSLQEFLGSYAVGGVSAEAGVERRRAHGRAGKAASTWVEGLRAKIRNTAG